MGYIYYKTSISVVDYYIHMMKGIVFFLTKQVILFNIFKCEKGHRFTIVYSL